MTLIAFATYGNHAEFITDTASYTRNVTQLGTTTKHLTLNHLDAAVLTQGDSFFGEHVKGGAIQAGAQVADFDDLIRGARPWIQAQWAETLKTSEGRAEHGTAFFLGWSGERKKFVAHIFASDRDFEPYIEPRMFVFPSPWAWRPSDLELGRMREYNSDRDDVDELIEMVSGRKRGRKPECIEDWHWLAREVRASRALNSFNRVIVAGQVFHTRLDRGGVQTNRIHTYDDSGDEFLRLVAFTQHHQGLLVACHCESGKRFIDCHLAPYLDGPCTCLSGKPMRECCAVPAAEALATAVGT